MSIKKLTSVVFAQCLGNNRKDSSQRVSAIGAKSKLADACVVTKMISKYRYP